MKYDILVRSYSGDKEVIFNMLLSTYQLFHLNLNFNLSVILDDEAKKDHELGNMLETLDETKWPNLKDNISVYYEKLPDDWKELFQIAFKETNVPKYTRWGYDRQQWSTFYFDKYSKSEVIGCVDSDVTLKSFIRHEDIFFENKIKLFVCQPTKDNPSQYLREVALHCGCEGSNYRNNKVALKQSTPYAYMVTGQMPIFFYRETFENCRNFISKQWNLSFDEAYKIFGREPYSQFDILVNYALSYESDKYIAIHCDRPFSLNNNWISYGLNGCWSKSDIINGFIRCFDINIDDLPNDLRAFCQQRLDNIFHVNRFGVWHTNLVEDSNNAVAYEIINKHFDSVKEETKKLNYDELLEKFISFLRNGFPKIKHIPNLPYNKTKSSNEYYK